MWSTRPTVSARGASRARASVARLRASQASSAQSGKGGVVGEQFHFETSQVATEAVTHDRMRRFQFEAG
jgi:hypothetical protein